MNSMFSNCNSINRIDMPNFETTEINGTINLVFDNCRNMNYLNLLNYKNKNIF